LTGITIVIGLTVFVFLRPHQSIIIQPAPTGQSEQSGREQAVSDLNAAQPPRKEKEMSGRQVFVQDKKTPPSNPQPPAEVAKRAMPPKPSQQATYHAEQPPVQPSPPKANNTPLAKDDPIQSIVVEGRLTYEMQGGDVEMPPDEMFFMPAGDANAYLISSDGSFPLDYVPPVRFEMQQDGRVVVTNIFSLQDNSELYWRPVESLRDCDSLWLPFITASYEHSLKKLMSFEIFYRVNGQEVWHIRFNTGLPPSAPGMTLRIPQTARQFFNRK